MFLLWCLWGVTLPLTFLIWYFYDDYKKQGRYTEYGIVLLGSLNAFMLLQLTLSIMTMYTAPHEPFVENHISLHTESLLKCAHEKLPSMRKHFTKIQKCLRYVDIYFIRNGLMMPHLRTFPEAFVISSDLKSVFVSSLFQSMSDTNKALVMIHECAHHALGAKDYAYIWQPHYRNLTTEQHLDNADSYMELIMNYCVSTSSNNAAAVF